MAETTELAVGYVSIIPETSKVGPGIEAALVQSANRISRFGTMMGSEIGKGIAEGMASGSAGMFSDVVREGERAGDKAGKGLSNKIVPHARKAGRDSGKGFFDEFKTTSERSGAVLGKIIAAPMRANIAAFKGLGGLAAKTFHGALYAGLGTLGLGGLGIGSIITKGAERLMGLDTAKRQIERMSRQFEKTGRGAIDAKAIEKMLTNEQQTGVLDKTPFSLNEAMGAVQLALQGGIKQGEQLTQYMTALGDAAGATQQPFNELAMIFNDIVTKGKLETDEIEQLQNRMINIPELLKQAYGWNNAELQQMLKDGKVGIDQVTNAIEQDMGGAAKSAGDTLEGAIQNLGNAAGRVGAKFIAAVTGTDEDPLAGMKEVVNWITTKLNELGQWITTHKDDLREFFQRAKEVAGDVVTAFGNIIGFLKEHPDLVKTAGLAFVGWQAISATATVATALLSINTALKAMPAAAAAAIAGLAPVGAAAAAALALYLVLKDDPNWGNKGTIGNGGGLTTPLGGFNPAGPMGPFGNPWAGMDNPGGVSSSVGGNAANSILGNMAAGGGRGGSAAGNSAAAILGGMAGTSGGNVSALPLVSGQWGSLDALAKNNFGMNMTSGFRDPNGPPAGAAGVPANQSYHGSGRAHDFSGSPEEMARFAGFMASTYGSQLKELIYGGPGWDPARNILNGQPHNYGTVTLQDHGLDNPKNAHVHVAFASGGGISGPGTGTSDSIPAWLSNGEHVLTAADVQAMGGQNAVYAFRSALHRAGGGPVTDWSGEELVLDKNGDFLDKPTNWLPTSDMLRKAQQSTATGIYRDSMRPWMWADLDQKMGRGNFNPSVLLDTSNASWGDYLAGGHFADGGSVPQAQIPWVPGDVTKTDPGPGNRPDLKPGAGYPGVIGLPQWGTPGTRFGPPPPGWWDRPINPDDVLFPDWMPPGDRDRWLEQWGENRKRWKKLGFAEGGDPLEELGNQHIGTGALPGSPVDPTTTTHGGAQGAQPGPGSAAVPDLSGAASEQPNYGMDFVRSLGFIPASAGNTGVAGTSSLAQFIGMGNQIVSGVIDTGTSLAETAVSAAITAGVAAGSFGAATPAAPLANMAASYGIQLAGNQAKRISAYWFQMAGIGADALQEQLFPFGAPRWLGYDYGQFAPQLGVQQALTSTVEKMGNDAIKKAFPTPGDPAAATSPAGPVTPATMPGAAAPLPGAPETPGPNLAPAGPSSAAPEQPGLLSNLMGYDQGGMLPPGGLGINMTNRPEPVLTPQQWDAIASSASAPAQGAPLVQNLYAQDMQDAIRQLDKVKRRDMMQYAGRP